jgi:hypothetical protein
VVLARAALGRLLRAGEGLLGRRGRAVHVARASVERRWRHWHLEAVSAGRHGRLLVVMLRNSSQKVQCVGAGATAGGSPHSRAAAREGARMVGEKRISRQPEQ